MNASARTPGVNRNESVRSLIEHSLIMSAVELSLCCGDNPEAALHQAGPELSAAQIHRIAKELPGCCLQQIPDRLTAEDFNTCAHSRPITAIQYAHHRLNAEQANYCVRKEPPMALLCIPGQIPAEFLFRLTETHRHDILTALCAKYQKTLAISLGQHLPRLTGTVRKRVLELLGSAI